MTNGNVVAFLVKDEASRTDDKATAGERRRLRMDIMYVERATDFLAYFIQTDIGLRDEALAQIDSNVAGLAFSVAASPADTAYQIRRALIRWLSTAKLEADQAETVYALKAARSRLRGLKTRHPDLEDLNDAFMLGYRLTVELVKTQQRQHWIENEFQPHFDELIEDLKTGTNRDEIGDLESLVGDLVLMAS
jgi:hypothetical protein